MILRLAIGIGAMLASTGVALAQTERINGDKGFERQVLSGARLYDATGATVRVTQGRNNTCFNIQPGSPNGAVFLGGRCLGEAQNRTLPWRELYNRGNGASVRFEGSRNLTVRDHYSEFAWDPIKPTSGSANWRVEDSWIKDARDDAIEADAGGAQDGVVLRTYFDRVHTFISVTPGKGRPIQGRPRIEFRDNIMSLGCGLDGGRPCENREKRLKYAWSRPRGSGQAFKVRGCGADIDILFRDNVVMMETGLNTSGSNLPVLQCMNVLPGSTGNTFYWLGGCGFRGLEMEQMDGACVPERFELDPAVWTNVSNDRAAWEAEVARWQARVWNGNGPQSEPEPLNTASEPEPEPLETASEPEPEPADDMAPDLGPTTTKNGEILVAVDARPEQCPNRVRADRSGNIPVVVAGTADFDVRDIELTSVRVAGVAPKRDRTRFRDRVSPFGPFVGKSDADDCTREGADGIEDLLMRFSNKQLVRALGRASRGAVVVPLTGRLEDGTALRGEEVLLVLD